MTRILYWNINNFSYNKLYDGVEGPDRNTHIVNEVFAPHAPHIFVVVEVWSRRADVMYPGSAVAGPAQIGVIGLLEAIRLATNNNNWMSVPALWSGKAGFCEAVAVYYDQAAVQFVGPYVYGPDYRTWSNTAPITRGCRPADTQRPAGAPATWPTGPRQYDPAWTNPFLGGPSCLPARVTPVVDPANGAFVMEDRLAAQYEFFTVGGQRIHFPSPRFRTPNLTYFNDLTVAGPGRRIKLFALHTSPRAAAGAVGQLQNIVELPAAANEVSVIVGDFNVDTFQNRAAYAGLLGMGFQLHFDSNAGGVLQPNRRPYCLTHYLPTARATPFGTAGVGPGPTHDVYPRFGYMGSMEGRRFNTPGNNGAIDNVLTQYGGGTAVPPANNNKTIVNTVIGKPYGAVAAPPAPADLVGGYPYASSMPMAAIPLPAGLPSNALAAPIWQNTFQSWPNFGRIRSTSDHLALLIDV
jgi:hypothetical protein